MTVFVALLRAVNVGKRKVPMAELRALCESLGYRNVATYIASGNIVFVADTPAKAVEAELEPAIAQRFGFPVDVISRTARQWSKYAAANPFPGESESEPNHTMMLLSKSALATDAVATLTERAGPGDRVATAGGVLWIYYANGMGRSKLTPTLIDRAVGSPTTARNWRSVLTLSDMAAAAGEHRAQAGPVRPTGHALDG